MCTKYQIQKLVDRNLQKIDKRNWSRLDPQVKINVEAVNAAFSAFEWLMNAISGIKVM